MGNPLLGVVFHWAGGFASASFYVPYRGVRRWSWEIYWLTGGIFSWLIAPWLFASIQTHDLGAVLAATPPSVIFWCVLFGALWGFGGLTYGLTMRYLGLSLGMAVVLGLCTLFGTLLPPIFRGDFYSKLIAPSSGQLVLGGLVLTLLGIIVVAGAGARKDAMLSPEAKANAVPEFAFRKGLAVAVFSGVMSSCFAFGLAAGEPISAISIAHGTAPLWSGLPVLCLIMAGGLMTNLVWCAWLIYRNRSARQWIGVSGAANIAAGDEAAEASPEGASAPTITGRTLLANYLFCALAGTTWYFQYFFYTMGESQMGKLGFSSWTLHMASIIIFGTVWGFGFREWTGATRRVKTAVWTGVALLILATVVIGYGNAMATRAGGA